MSRLVVLGVDGNVRVVAADGTRSDDLTHDVAGATRHHHPTWMPDGRSVVWSSTGSPTEGSLEVARPDGTGRRSFASGFPAFYLFPGPDGRHVAHLGEGPLGLELAVLDLAEGTSTLVTRGAPLYWSWAPDGRRLAVHVGDELCLASPDGGVEALDEAPGSFLAPCWADDRLVFVARREGGQSLVVADRSGGTSWRVADVEGAVRFVADPRGRRVAWLEDRAGAPGLRVADREGARRLEVTPEPVLGFWWSPDSAHLLTLGPAPDDGLPWVSWSVWDGERPRPFAPFLPSALFLRQVLPFFEQFAQSHRLWAPDSAAFAYAGVSREGERGVWVQALEGGAPRLVADGIAAWWSPV